MRQPGSSIAIIQARMSSNRLPGKVLMPAAGKSMLQWQLLRLSQSQLIDSLWVATSNDASDDCIAEHCASLGQACYRGSLYDVLDRYWQTLLFAEQQAQSQYSRVIRLTADCPLIDPRLIDQGIVLHRQSTMDYVSNAAPRTYAHGLDLQIVSRNTLFETWRQATELLDREHVLSYIHCRLDRASQVHLQQTVQDSIFRYTLDYYADYQLIEAVISGLLVSAPHAPFELINQWLLNHPEVMQLNQMHRLVF